MSKSSVEALKALAAEVRGLLSANDDQDGDDSSSTPSSSSSSSSTSGSSSSAAAAETALLKLKGVPPKGPAGSLLPAPLRYQLLSLKGLACLRAGKKEKAERVLERATELRPQLPLAWKALSDLHSGEVAEQHAITSDARSSSSTVATAREKEQAANRKLIGVLLKLVGIFEEKKDKPARLRALSDSLALAYARQGDIPRAVGVLSNAQIFDVMLTWPRIALLYQQLPDQRDTATKLEQLYKQVGHDEGLIDIYWRAGRLDDILELSWRMVERNALSHAGMESLLVLCASDNGGVQLDDSRKLTFARKLAFYWPDRPFGWSFVVPDREMDDLQSLLLKCPGAVEGWLRLARLRLKAQQPKLCNFAIQHGMLTIQRLMLSGFSSDHPLSEQPVFWEQTPMSPKSTKLVESNQALRFRRCITLFRLVEAQLTDDVTSFEAVLNDSYIADQPQLLAAAHRGIGRVHLSTVTFNPYSLPSSSSSASSSSSSSSASSTSSSTSSSTLELAKQHLQKALELEPGDHFSMAAIGWIHHLHHNENEAKTLIERAIELDDQRVAEYRYYLGQVHWALGNLDEAHKAHLAAAKLDTTRAKYFTAIGEYYRSVAKDAHNAILAFRKAVSLDAHQSHAGVELARLLLANGRVEQAVELYENVTRRSSQAEWAWIRLGEHRLRTTPPAANQLETALVCFQTALRSAAGSATPNPRCLRGLATTYFRQGKYVAALKVFQRIVVLQPNDIYSHVHVGLIYATVGMPTAAIKQFELVVARQQQLLLEQQQQRPDAGPAEQEQPTSQPVVVFLLAKSVYRLGVDKLGRGQGRTATSLFQRARELLLSTPMPTSPSYYALLSSVHASLREYDLCTAALERRSQLTGQHDHYRQALCLYARGNKSEAYQAFRRAVEERPCRLEAWNALGACASLPEEAQHAFLLCLSPDFASLPNHDLVVSRAWNNLGVLYFQRGQSSLAQQAFHLAQALNPEGSAAWAAQAVILQQSGQYAQALSAYQHTLEQECTLFALGGLATVLYQAGDYSRAYQYLVQWRADERLRQALEDLDKENIDNDDEKRKAKRQSVIRDLAWLHQLFARTSLRLGLLQQAQHHLQEAVALLQPSDAQSDATLLQIVDDLFAEQASVDKLSAHSDALLFAYLAFVQEKPAATLGFLHNQPAQPAALEHRPTAAATLLMKAMTHVSLRQLPDAASTLDSFDALKLERPALYFFVRAQLEVIANEDSQPLGSLPRALLQGQHLYPDSNLLQRLFWGHVHRSLRRHNSSDLSSFFSQHVSSSPLSLKRLLLTAESSVSPTLLGSLLEQCARSADDLQLARSYLARALHLDPSDFHSAALLAHLSYRLALVTQQPDHFAAALASCNTCLGFDNTLLLTPRLREHFLLIMSDCHRFRGEFDAALKRAKDTGSTSGYMFRQVARVLFSQGRLDHALQFYKKALKEPSLDAQPTEHANAIKSALWQELAFVYTKLSPPLYSAAQLCYQQAVALDNSRCTAMLRLAALHLQTNKPQEAAALITGLKPSTPLDNAVLLIIRASIAELSTGGGLSKATRSSIERARGLAPQVDQFWRLLQTE